MLSDGSVAALARAAPPRLAPPPQRHNGQWDLGLGGPLGALCQRAQRTSGLSSLGGVPSASTLRRAGLGVSASECLATAHERPPAHVGTAPVAATGPAAAAPVPSRRAASTLSLAQSQSAATRYGFLGPGILTFS